MLKLKDITKVYQTGDIRVEAVKDINLSFERGEFVAILGPSGCGKTTLLNIIGGLDRYTLGDLAIGGRSTKDYTEREMDAYRNHSVGFVFQSYNLIPHQSVLANVELALTLSGTGQKERRKRAEEALIKVGLKDQMKKKPNQLSGGQMQRVAIARAIVNDPDVLLADEPTGALDSLTSVQVMDRLKELAHDRLVIMVTHNRELAQRYATRIIELRDGKVVSDSSPQTTAPLSARTDGFKKTAMSFKTALSLSLNNLLTKRGRTLITAFAGSIGIIGIALILALSNGMNEYIINIQKNTMVSYPITLQEQAVKMDSFMDSVRSAHSKERTHELDAVYLNMESRDQSREMSDRVVKNNLTALKQYLEQPGNMFAPYLTDVRYDYNTRFNLYGRDRDGEIISMNTASDNSFFSAFAFNMYQSGAAITELEPASPDGLAGDSVKETNTLIAGQWPKSANEIVLIVDSNNEIEESLLYALGKIKTIGYPGFEDTENVKSPETLRFEYADFLGLEFSWLIPGDMYRKGEDGLFKDLTRDSIALQTLVNNAPKLKLVGIVRANDDRASTSGSLGYTRALADQVILRGEETAVVIAQKEQKERDVVTGLWFAPETAAQKAENTKIMVNEMSSDEKALFAQRAYRLLPEMKPGGGEGEKNDMALPRGMDMNSLLSMMQAFTGNSSEGATGLPQDFLKQISQTRDGMGDAQLAAFLDSWILTADDETLAKLYDEFLSGMAKDLHTALSALGAVNRDLPSGISLFTDSFDNKEKLTQLIDQYNAQADEGDQIVYTDYLAVMISGVSTIINAISMVLIAFVAVSLVVSSIMIGIITYISVLERIKEIGILRAIGASRRDVRRVFTAEAFIIGFAAGLLGVVISFLLTIPINSIIYQLTQDASVKAILPLSGAFLLILISSLLSLLAGWLPSRIAAKKDPVEALRSE